MKGECGVEVYADAGCFFEAALPVDPFGNGKVNTHLEPNCKQPQQELSQQHSTVDFHFGCIAYFGFSLFQSGYLVLQFITLLYYSSLHIYVCYSINGPVKLWIVKM